MEFANNSLPELELAEVFEELLPLGYQYYELQFNLADSVQVVKRIWLRHTATGFVTGAHAALDRRPPMFHFCSHGG